MHHFWIWAEYPMAPYHDSIPAYWLPPAKNPDSRCLSNTERSALPRAHRYSDKSPACLARHFRIHLLFFAPPKKNSFCRLPTIGECSASCAGQNLLHLCRATYIHHWYHHTFVPISYSKSAQKSTFALSILTQAASLHFLRFSVFLSGIFWRIVL